jgi:uracil-DNA glycosylase
MDMSNNMTTDWRPLLESETKKDYFKQLVDFVNAERKKATVFPSPTNVFKALHVTPYEKVRVVIIGQDPYHNDNQAMGLSFSVPEGLQLPPSLQNIYKELTSDVGVKRQSGDLSDWAAQGVLLINSVLTVRAHEAASHQGKGWELFTDEILRVINKKSEHVVFILWGGFARKKKSLIDPSTHTIIESAHPSPLSAYAGFFGSKPFSQTNEALAKHQQQPIRW